MHALHVDTVKFVATVRIRIEYSLTTRHKCTMRDAIITMSDTRLHRLPFSNGAVCLSVDCTVFSSSCACILLVNFVSFF